MDNWLQIVQANLMNNASLVTSEPVDLARVGRNEVDEDEDEEEN